MEIVSVEKDGYSEEWIPLNNLCPTIEQRRAEPQPVWPYPPEPVAGVVEVTIKERRPDFAQDHSGIRWNEVETLQGQGQVLVPAPDWQPDEQWVRVEYHNPDGGMQVAEDCELRDTGSILPPEPNLPLSSPSWALVVVLLLAAGLRRAIP